MEPEMVTLDELARRVRKKYRIKKDAELAALLGVTRAAISAHKGPRSQRRAKVYSEEVAIRMAELLGLERDYALLCWAADRAKEKYVKEAWQNIAARLAGMAAGLLLIVGLAFPFAPSYAQTQTVIRSVIVSDFDGLDHGKIFVLQNGQIWRQTEYWIWVWIWVDPQVLIYQDGAVWKMHVENIDHTVTVERLK